MDVFDWLMKWYQSNCDGDWEHCYGMKIETLDNPGWSIQINLLGTVLENKDFNRKEIDNGEDDWIFCWVENDNFEAAGDASKLIEMIKVFKEWAES